MVRKWYGPTNPENPSFNNLYYSVFTSEFTTESLPFPTINQILSALIKTFCLPISQQGLFLRITFKLAINGFAVEKETKSAGLHHRLTSLSYNLTG